MKTVITTEVFLDTVTGLCYSKVGAIRPIAVLSEEGAPASQGILLVPYVMHPKNNPLFLGAGDEHSKTLGYAYRCAGHSILASPQLLTSRFENLGPYREVIDLDQGIAHYESEECNFEDRESVAHLVTSLLSRRTTVDHETCLIYTMLKDYQETSAKLAATAEPESGH